eukprot:gnl/TRDRNA2_/TRDRNA2_172822_c0_seq3.p1 gnl/TRDRNA2_/TRDRNA2_172822_c0~~gnl/TRDRNA2_/TRDRNA2_172822_c0_seq3.p1  ORF type:complete len:414 (+),score=45.80 gnl/TRDRNA2_/TRDRNA2_172822_c0_seq3:176-1243(+)
MAHTALKGGEYKDIHGEEAWAELMGTYAVMVGMASLLLAALGAGSLASHVPGPVSAGWKLGFALTVVAAQAAGATFSNGSATVRAQCILPQLFPDGPRISGGTAAMYRLAWILLHPHVWDEAATALAGLTLVTVICTRGFVERICRLPGSEVLIACALGTLVATGCGYSGAVVGMPPVQPEGSSMGVNPITSWISCWPWQMPWAETAERLGGWAFAIPSAVIFAGVNFLAIMSVEAEKAPPGGWSPARELAGQGVGCIVSGMSGSAPVGGSLSRSMVAGMTGASSPVMSLVCGMTSAILAVPQVSVLLAPTPKATLAAVVLAAVLPSVVRPRDVLCLRGVDAAVAWASVSRAGFD